MRVSTLVVTKSSQGSPGPIRAGLVVVVDRPEEALAVEREARAVVLSVWIVVPREDVERLHRDDGSCPELDRQRVHCGDHQDPSTFER